MSVKSVTKPVATLEGMYIDTPHDALIVFEAYLRGQLNEVLLQSLKRDLQDQKLIRGGNVFIYNEHRSCIRRWLDGRFWNRSCSSGNFLVYRELLQSRKQSSLKPKKHDGNVCGGGNEKLSFTGPLADGMKPNGLVKKTIKITYRNEPYHLVSYHKWEKVKLSHYTTPSQDLILKSIIPRSELMDQDFRAPIRTSISNTDGHSYDRVPMDQQGAFPMGCPANFMGFSLAPEQLFLGQMQQQQQQLLHHPYHLQDQPLLLTQIQRQQTLQQQQALQQQRKLWLQHALRQQHELQQQRKFKERLRSPRKPYLHESRHKHAMRRPRGPGERFPT